MKNALIRFLQWLFSSPEIFLKFKDTALTSPAEHLFRAARFISEHKLSSAGKVIIDVGVADGNTCLYFSREFPNAEIMGFEPVKSSYETALRTTSRFPNIRLHHLALSDENGEAEMHVLEDSLSSSLNAVDNTEFQSSDSRHALKFVEKRKEKVTVRRLDSFLTGAEQVLLMKIDTQGNELQVLKGAAETLKRTRLVLVEMNNHRQYLNTSQYYEVDSLLRENGFRLRDIFVIYRDKGIVKEYDALYENCSDVK
jgi:FkbM family methyltransferase